MHAANDLSYNGSQHRSTPEAGPHTPARVRQRRRCSTGVMCSTGDIPAPEVAGAQQRRPGTRSNGLTTMISSRRLGLDDRPRNEHSSHHVRLTPDEAWMHDLVKPLGESSPDFSSGTTATACSSTIDSSRIDRLINEDENKNKEEEVVLETATPRRRLARLSSVTQLFRKGGNGDGNEPAQEGAPDSSSGPKLMARFMKGEGASEEDGKKKRGNRRASIN